MADESSRESRLGLRLRYRLYPFDASVGVGVFAATQKHTRETTERHRHEKQELSPGYSCLSAVIGSIRLALRAGIQQASVATPTRIAGTPIKTGRLIAPLVIA